MPRKRNLRMETYNKLISIGKSTEKKLNEYKIENIILPASFDEVGLAEAVFGI